MKKFDCILALTVPVYLILAVALWFLLKGGEAGQDVTYKVEINQIMQGLEMEGTFSKPDLREANCVREAVFLSADTDSAEDISAFYRNRNGMHMTVRPLIVRGATVGYVRFDYVLEKDNGRVLYGMEGILLFVWLAVSGMLWYIRQQVIRPFHILEEMPCELAKGNLQWEPEESKSRFFGKFVWGVGMLRDALRTSRERELKLEKDKKMLLLSVSHDIKIPLSAIKLYAKALREGIYETEEERIYGAVRIEQHAQEIETFVREIVSTASEDIFAIEVEASEFYLESYVTKIRECYEPKCRLVMTDFRIGGYENKLLKGDIDRAFEVVENLMENAFKYGDGKKICISFREEDYCQVVSIFNSGTVPGEDEMPHLFDSFFRGSNAGGQDGNGLGLYISRQIMRKMGGDIFAGRREDGMEFCLVFEPDC